jgi:hypothetical protein
VVAQRFPVFAHLATLLDHDFVKIPTSICRPDPLKLVHAFICHVHLSQLTFERIILLVGWASYTKKLSVLSHVLPCVIAVLSWLSTEPSVVNCIRSERAEFVRELAFQIVPSAREVLRSIVLIRERHVVGLTDVKRPGISFTVLLVVTQRLHVKFSALLDHEFVVATYAFTRSDSLEGVVARVGAILALQITRKWRIRNIFWW